MAICIFIIMDAIELLKSGEGHDFIIKTARSDLRVHLTAAGYFGMIHREAQRNGACCRLDKIFINGRKAVSMILKTIPYSDKDGLRNRRSWVDLAVIICLNPS